MRTRPIYQSRSSPGLVAQIRSDSGLSSGRPVLYGYFAKWDEWAENNSSFEGHFMERIAPGAFAR
jgi:phage head maturation protease